MLLFAVAFSPLLGCSGGTEPQPAFIYDTCLRVDDCVEAATRCEELNVEFAGYVYNNAICTTECSAEGPLSLDCSRAYIGRPGSCYPASVAGGADDTLICFEPCDTDVDCLYGFRCLGAIELCGAEVASCPIIPNDALCVPGLP